MSLRDHLQEIYDTHGKLTPELVVQVARPAGHPLHDRVFDRPVKEAAEAWYRVRAYELIREVRVVYREATEDVAEGSVREWHAIRSTDEAIVYKPVAEIVGDDLLTQMLMREMEREWKALHRRYAHFKEFVEMVRGDLAA